MFPTSTGSLAMASVTKPYSQAFPLPSVASIVCVVGKNQIMLKIRVSWSEL